MSLANRNLQHFNVLLNSKYEDMGDMILPHNTKCRTVGTVVFLYHRKLKCLFTQPVYCYYLFLTYKALTEVAFFLCCYTTKIHTATVMILTTTSTSKVCGPITTVGVLKIWHWNNLYAHSWKTGCLGLCQYVTSLACKSQCSAKVHIMYVMRCALRIVTEQGSSSRSADLHLWSKIFKFWLRYRPPWGLFSVPPGKCWDNTLNSTTALPFYTLSHSHHCHLFSSHCIILVTGSVDKWTACKCTHNNEHIL